MAAIPVSAVIVARRGPTSLAPFSATTPARPNDTTAGRAGRRPPAPSDPLLVPITRWATSARSASRAALWARSRPRGSSGHVGGMGYCCALGRAKLLRCVDHGPRKPLTDPARGAFTRPRHSAYATQFHLQRSRSSSNFVSAVTLFLTGQPGLRRLVSAMNSMGELGKMTASQLGLFVAA